MHDPGSGLLRQGKADERGSLYAIHPDHYADAMADGGAQLLRVIAERRERAQQ